jgi:hypothetical protein
MHQPWRKEHLCTALTVVQESCNTDKALRIFFDKTSVDKTSEYLSQVRHVCLRTIVANVRLVWCLFNFESYLHSNRFTKSSWNFGK